MQFRKDINGLRAIAVIAIVLFHFNDNWMPGGFAGVDVFFVISGFLMTSIIFTGIKKETFSTIKFYVSRANRIIPALAFLCFVLVIFGWFYLTPTDYQTLGKHVGSSVGFLSNFIYWREAGYFDVDSHRKWLLHTWSLSVEWQFYILYPLLLVGLSKCLSLKSIKVTLLLATVFGYLLCIYATYRWPDPAYYLLHARAWEMMVGGLAYLYPFNLSDGRKKGIEWLGLALIILSYVFISKANFWPGYLAIFPVLGAFLLIQAQRNDSVFTGNRIFQALGKWSYSIYLWHWPLVVAIGYFSLSRHYLFLGLLLSVVLGWASYHFIERRRFRSDIYRPAQLIKCKPIYFTLGVGLLGSVILATQGFIKQSPIEYQKLVTDTRPSPQRDSCHIHSYQSPDEACEYFGKNVTWATFGDSHTVEIAYALARKLKPYGQGIKHFSFSGCKPAYQDRESTPCAKWYNDAVDYIIEDEGIRNVVFNHRFTQQLMGGNADHYPAHQQYTETDEVRELTSHIDKLILLFAAKKDNVYVFYPVPELPKDIHQLMGDKLRRGASLDNIVGTDTQWYEHRNAYMIQHFDNANYPANVHLLKPQDVFCDPVNCYAVKEGTALYFDEDHPSVAGAKKLVELIELN
ncbi:acyltransferase family protein [Alteromonas sp. C1M14]|uniref:acyltransferase family protein n=1 Tax=Alteromonas sp. C1M14 TaxID=2841567 RepID=UPI001C09F29F|nr:acyltransferase family protein [Alteromonas sp. C1M14]MBU2979592.1 acyltransferase [Alteromonas sp. C1M14]